MTQEDKQLLLTDICARLPYEVNVLVSSPHATEPIRKKLNTNLLFGLQKSVLTIKPYLRPMSSMTEEEFEDLKSYSGLIYSQLDLASYQNGTYKCLDFYLSEIPSDVVILVFDWLNKNHFDYRGLIERGLAIEVTEENNPYEKNSLA